MKYSFSYRMFKRTAIALLCVLLMQPALQAQDDYEEGDTTGIAVAPVLEEEHANYQEKQHVVTPPAYRQVPDSLTRRLKRQKDFAYANDPSYWAREAEEEDGKDFWDWFYRLFSSGGLHALLYVLLIGFFIFIIYRVIVVNNLYLFYRSKKSPAITDETIADIEDENLDEKINKAIDQKEHRMAVRYMYMKALRLLNDRQWIRYHAQATNYEYVQQMSGQKMSEEFRFLTRIYDYVWYGEFALTDEQFKLVHNNFLHFYNAVK